MTWTIEERVLEAIMTTDGLTRFQLFQLMPCGWKRFEEAIRRLEEQGMIDRVEAWALGDRRNIAA